MDIDLWAPLLPVRRPESCTIRGVGTTSWFLLPVSTCGICVSCSGGLRRIVWKADCGENAPVLTVKVAKRLCVELHPDRRLSNRCASKYRCLNLLGRSCGVCGELSFVSDTALFFNVKLSFGGEQTKAHSRAIHTSAKGFIPSSSSRAETQNYIS